MESDSNTNGAAEPGLLESLKGFGVSCVDAVKTRIEVFSTDLHEEKQQLAWVAALGLAALLLLAFGMMTLTLLVVVLFWEKHRVLVLSLFTVLYLGGGSGIALAVRRRLKSGPRPFSATLAELNKDRAYLTSRKS